MKINKITAESFGKLKNKTVELSPGINVVTGANESGKSTVARFLRFMLYGFTSRASEISKNDKKKYLPWDGNAFRGELELTSGEKNYTVRREQTARASHSITDSDGVPVFKGMTAGEAFLGVDEDTYDKTAFISSGDVYFDNAVSLSAAIKNMVFSADSDVDSESALKKLDTLRKSILGKTERSGSLYDARLELAELVSRKGELAEAHRELLGAEASLERVCSKLEQNRKIIETLTAEMENIEAYEAKNICLQLDELERCAESSREKYENMCRSLTVDGFLPNRKYLAGVNEKAFELQNADASVDTARAELDTATRYLAESYGDIKQLQFNEKLEKSGKTAEKLQTEIDFLKGKLKSKKKLAIILTVLVVTIPIAVFLWLGCSKITKELARLAEAFGSESVEVLEKMLLLAESSARTAESAKKRKETAENSLSVAESARARIADELSRLLEKCGAFVSDTSNIAEQARGLIKKLELEITDLDTAEHQMQIDQTAYENRLQSSGGYEKLKTLAGKFDGNENLRDKAKVKFELGFYTSANDELAKQKYDYEKKTAVISANMEQPDELEAKISFLEKKIAELELRHRAVVLASEAIEEAHGEMRGNVSPILTKNASELFSAMTGGKYVGLYVDDELKLSFLEKGSSEYRSVDYLSSGAADSAYLALRITLIQYLYSTPPVLVFDDAFSKLDDERLKNVCDCLKTLSEKYQIIILTCHDREAKALGVESLSIN